METISPARLKGRARGALICGIFGGIWMLDPVFFGAVATRAWLAAVAFPAVAFVAWPLSRVRSLRHLKYSTTADRQRWSTLAGPFWADAATEWLVCAGAAFWLSHIHRYDLILPAIGVIIGLHFLPLARIFRMPLYYATGVVMVLGGLVSLEIPPGNMRVLVACSIMGLSLWATAMAILCRDRLSFGGKEGAS